MKSSINQRFLKAYRRLPADVRKQAREAYRLFKLDHYHKSLRFKKVSPNEPLILPASL